MRRRTSVHIDEDKLARVQSVLGTTGIKDTIDRAFDEVLAAYLRERLAQRILTGEGIDRSEAILRETRPAK